MEGLKGIHTRKKLQLSELDKKLSFPKTCISIMLCCFFPNSYTLLLIFSENSTQKKKKPSYIEIPSAYIHTQFVKHVTMIHYDTRRARDCATFISHGIPVQFGFIMHYQQRREKEKEKKKDSYCEENVLLLLNRKKNSIPQQRWVKNSPKNRPGRIIPCWPDAGLSVCKVVTSKHRSFYLPPGVCVRVYVFFFVVSGPSFHCSQKLCLSSRSRFLCFAFSCTVEAKRCRFRARDGWSCTFCLHSSLI